MVVNVSRREILEAAFLKSGTSDAKLIGRRVSLSAAAEGGQTSTTIIALTTTKRHAFNVASFRKFHPDDFSPLPAGSAASPFLLRGSFLDFDRRRIGRQLLDGHLPRPSFASHGRPRKFLD